MENKNFALVSAMFSLEEGAWFVMKFATIWKWIENKVKTCKEKNEIEDYTEVQASYGTGLISLDSQ